MMRQADEYVEWVAACHSCFQQYSNPLCCVCAGVDASRTAYVDGVCVGKE
jgi:hypothetical protein